MSRQAAPSCPLCDTRQGRLFCIDARRGRRYRRCPDCRLTWLDPEQRPNPARERAEYALHQNDPADPGYRQFLSRVADPLQQQLQPGSQGLDYGCGPAAVLADMLTAAGLPTTAYDPCFRAEPAALSGRYDFISCTETAEHFFHPGREFRRLTELLRPGGVLAVMTGRLTEDARFARWRYRHDPTHVCFYRDETFAWLEQHVGYSRVYRRGDVWIGRRLA
ncbi:class I SAM-dependent methyltransferase [Gammaproteobacteria bacterium AB-CW1]|uniref:Class I SAM-dependent methyltransferase n=1 Tax=Natronospira elongata TaxID=3110268 RepID=A0AAP6ML07_9GAMM|nr:class I SAM-dependent methyltransferase [Gammaproteobacteria bacterium AB-CW1]